MKGRLRTVELEWSQCLRRRSRRWQFLDSAHDESLIHVTEGPTSSGLTSETVEFFHAANVRKVAVGGGVKGEEEIEVHVVPLAEVREWLRTRENETTFIDPKVYAGLWLVGE